VHAESSHGPPRSHLGWGKRLRPVRVSVPVVTL
jgi:hypothetical protein